jgi:hypothetical protein
MIQRRPAQSEAEAAHIDLMRVTQILCAMSHALFRLEDRLADLTALAQQRNDLMRRKERMSNDRQSDD